MTRTKLMALALATLLIAACGGGDSGDATGPEPVKQTGTLTLVNGSHSDVIAVNFPSCEDPDWGTNRLGASEAIEPGAERSWTIETGCYDLKTSNGAKAAYWYDIQITAGATVEISIPAAIDPKVVATGLGTDLRAR